MFEVTKLQIHYLTHECRTICMLQDFKVTIEETKTTHDRIIRRYECKCCLGFNGGLSYEFVDEMFVFLKF